MGGSPADFFGHALRQHVALYFAVDMNPDDPVAGADFHAFLSEVHQSLAALPPVLLRKSPSPLGLVIGDHRLGSSLGEQILKPGAPSILFWRAFRSLRESLQDRPHASLATLIRKTILHEMIGHQLAFCCVNGPHLPAEDFLDILRIAGITSIPLTDGSEISPADLASTKDLLKEVRRIRYILSPRCPNRYYENPIEMVAFAIEGEVSPNSTYAQIKRVLRRNLLRDPCPLQTVPGASNALYRGYDLSETPVTQYFIEATSQGLRETEASETAEGWVSKEALIDQLQSAKTGVQFAQELTLQPGRGASVNVPPRGCFVNFLGKWYLACAFGILEQDCRGDVQKGPQLTTGVHLNLDHRGTAINLIISNDSPQPLVVHLRESR
jgi:hypothetical protein